MHIAQAFAIFSGDRMKAINMCVNRFDTDTKLSFLDLYTKVDAGVETIGGTDDVTSTMKEELETLAKVIDDRTDRTNRVTQVLSGAVN